MNAMILAMLGGTEIMWIAIVVLVLFGAKKVPELMKGVGTGIKEFKKASRDVQDEVHRAMDSEDHNHQAPPTPRPPSDTISHSSKG